MLQWSIPVEENRFKDPSYYYILVSETEMVTKLVSMIQEGSSGNRGRNALIALANILGGDHSLLPFSKVASIVEDVESKEPQRATLLPLAYQIAAFYNTDESLSFLVERTTEEFWAERGMPTYEWTVPDAPGRSNTLETAQTIAISAVAKHPSPKAEVYLNSLLSDPEYSGDELLFNWINNALKRRYEYHLLSYERRQEAQQIKDSRNQTDANREEPPVVEVAPDPPVKEFAEVIEGGAAPEPVTEEPAEVVAAEPVGEEIERSPDWWLWLVGVVVVVVCTGLVLRRKS